MQILKPVIIIGAPRSGTTLLFSILSSAPELWSLYREGEFIYREIYGEQQCHQGHYLDVKALENYNKNSILKMYYKNVINYQLIMPNLKSVTITHRLREYILRNTMGLLSNALKPSQIRIVEKNPRNCMRINVLKKLFPDSIFIHLTRHPITNVSSLFDGWRSDKDKYITMKNMDMNIRDYDQKSWRFVRPPGWKEYLKNHTLAEVCAFQYIESNLHALNDLKDLPKDRVLRISYEELINEPVYTLNNICKSIGIPYSKTIELMSKNLPEVNAVSKPSMNKWKNNEEFITPVYSSLEKISEMLGYDMQGNFLSTDDLRN